VLLKAGTLLLVEATDGHDVEVLLTSLEATEKTSFADGRGRLEILLEPVENAKADFLLVFRPVERLLDLHLDDGEIPPPAEFTLALHRLVRDGSDLSEHDAAGSGYFMGHRFLGHRDIRRRG